MRRPNHASRFEGIAKTNLQASSASDTETLQSQVDKAGKKRLSLSGLEILHGRLSPAGAAHSMRASAQVTASGAITNMIVAVSTTPNRENRSTCSRMCALSTQAKVEAGK